MKALKDCKFIVKIFTDKWPFEKRTHYWTAETKNEDFGIEENWLCSRNYSTQKAAINGWCKFAKINNLGKVTMTIYPSRKKVKRVT